MKRILFLISLLSVSFIVRAQWSSNGNNICYNTGNIGIGTTARAAPVHISLVMAPGAVNEVLRFEQRGEGGNELGGNILSIQTKLCQALYSLQLNYT
ncbi:hypothetical protein [Mucilaginibacter kameinonensis]|uniref:hypothetical protein n=1 Tax=Mucilaginibacter kameinonensis TaxID=452286 RepID=UPI000EF7E8AF|nr:hypothetical protein [Mucilaginibacter kameinonensis]